MPKSNISRLAVPALTGGISTQPEGQRFPNQTSEAINVNLDLVRGLEKRDGTRLESVLDGITSLGNVISTHWVWRDEDEHYVFIASDSGLRIFNILSGVECQVDTTALASTNYLNNLTSFLTIADTTYAVNGDVVVATDPSVESAYSRDDADTDQVADWSELETPGSIPQYRNVLADYPGHPAGFYEALSTTALPYWGRVPTPEADSNFDASTMPVRIRNTALNTFEVTEAPWTGRLDGDYLTNPPATFVGQKITGLAFWADRLWIYANQQLVGSRTNDLLNFWIDDEANLTDADPIDLSIGADSAQGITHAVPYSQTLLLFSGSSRQYEVTSGSSGVVGTSTVSLRETTSYPAPTTEPIRLGSYLYFPTEGGGSSRMYEYIITDGTVPSAANDVISHTYGYIPADVIQCLSLSQTDQIFIRCASTQDLFVYQQRFSGQEKIQNSVFKWQVAGEMDSIVSMDAYGSTLYLLIEKDTGGSSSSVRVESVFTARSSDDVNQDDFDYPISLDGKQTLRGVYDENTGKTTWTSAVAFEDVTLGVLGEEWSNYQVYSRGAKELVTIDRSGTTVAVTQPTSTTFEAAGDWSTGDVIFGRVVDMDVLLSQLFVRDDQGVPVAGTLQLKKLLVHHRDTGYFAVSITPPARETRTLEYTSKQVGLFSFSSNEDLIEGPGMFPVPVMSSAAGVEIRITSDNPAPANIPYLETLGGFVPSKTSTTNYR